MSPKQAKIIDWIVALVCVALLAFMFFGCGDEPRTVAPVIASPKSMPVSISAPATPPKDQADAREQASEARAQIAFWQARLQVAEESAKRLAKEERQHWLEMACRWVIGICFVGLLGNVALFAASFVWPWFARLRMVAAGGAAAALVLIVVVWCIPALVTVAAKFAGVAALIGIGWTIWHFHGEVKATLKKVAP